ncbi:MAG: S53 family peptidase, partial [Bryobacteraceae bacterium]
MFWRSLVLPICIFSLGLAAQDRVTKAVDPSQVTQVRGNVSPKAQARFDLGPADAAMEIPYLTIRLKHSDAQQAALDQLLAEQQTPGSPNYRKWLTPQVFGERFGLSVNDLAKVTGWLQSQGLTVNDVAAGRQWITFSGTVRQINSAFHTTIHLYRSGAETRYANSTEPFVPKALWEVVAGFDRLNDFPAHSDHIVVPAYNNGGAHYLAPADFATIYDLNKLYQQGIDGTGVKIAIVGRTDINLADIAAFRSQFGLPANPPQVVLYGPDPGSNSSGDLDEADLDLEWSGAVAYNATIIYVNSKDVNISAQYAIDNNLAPVMSYSYSLCEQETTTAFRSIAQQAAAQGITWMASSGDSGSTACDPDTTASQATLGLAVNVPASFPEITAVGGTMFNEGTGVYWSSANGTNLESALSYIPEIVWNEDNGDYYGIASGGGGASLFFSKPAWQAGPGVPNDGARDVPDVAMNAAIHDGYAVTSGGVQEFLAGTSAASPTFAGIVALLNQYLVKHGTIQTAGLGNINPTLYRLAQSSSGIFHD